MSPWISLLLLSFLVASEISFQQSEVYGTLTSGRRDDFATSAGVKPHVVKRLKRNSPDSSCLCVPIRRCGTLYEIYQKGQSMTSEEKETLKENFCRIQDGKPVVCCADLPKKSLDKFSKCGDNVFNIKNLSQERIVGRAHPAVLGDYPWMTAIYARSKKNARDTEFQCGGTLISNVWVVSAAHCVPKTGLNRNLSHVILGDLDLDKSVKDGASPIKVNIAEVISHPQYDEKTVMNDIALLRLSKPVAYSTHIQPICLHSGAKYLEDRPYYYRQKPTVIGWGTIDNPEGDRLKTTKLMEADIPMVNFTLCQTNYGSLNVRIDQTRLCVGKGGTDACQGDSGGPLMFKDFATGIWSQGGIVSFGRGCGEKDFPGIYTRIAVYIDWLEEVTKLKF